MKERNTLKCILSLSSMSLPPSSLHSLSDAALSRGRRRWGSFREGTHTHKKEEMEVVLLSHTMARLSNSASTSCLKLHNLAPLFPCPTAAATQTSSLWAAQSWKTWTSAFPQMVQSRLSCVKTEWTREEGGWQINSLSFKGCCFGFVYFAWQAYYRLLKSGQKEAGLPFITFPTAHSCEVGRYISHMGCNVLSL